MFTARQHSPLRNWHGRRPSRGAQGLIERKLNVESLESRLPLSAVVDLEPPQVLSVDLNMMQNDPPPIISLGPPTDWMTQRSEIRDLVITMTESVVATAADISLVNLGVKAFMTPDVPISLSDSQVQVMDNQVIVSFVDPLPDGVYALEIQPTLVDLAGNPLDGDGDSVGGDALVMIGSEENGLYQYEADWNGDCSVSIYDFPSFVYWIFIPTAPEYLDLNHDGSVSIYDFAPFASQFGSGVEFPGENLTTQVLSVEINANMHDPADMYGMPQPSSWQTQRSDLGSVVITLNQNVNATATDFRLLNLGVNAPAEADVEVPLQPYQVYVLGNRVTIDLSGEQLADGVYALQILPTLTDYRGEPLDGDGDGTAGGVYTLIGSEENGFFQYGGDWNGDCGVSIYDFPTYMYWAFYATQPNGPAPQYMDVNHDGMVTHLDWVPERFGTAIVFQDGLTSARQTSTAERKASIATDVVVRQLALEAVLAETDSPGGLLESGTALVPATLDRVLADGFEMGEIMPLAN
jgi:hypothetical protein